MWFSLVPSEACFKHKQSVNCEMNIDRHYFQWFVKAKRLRSWSDWSKFPRFYTAIQQPSDQLRIRRIRTALNVSESRNWKYLVSTIVMVRLEPGNSERRIRGNYKMGNENKLQLKFAVVVVFLNEIFSFYRGFPWDVIFYPSGLLYNFFWVFLV